MNFCERECNWPVRDFSGKMEDMATSTLLDRMLDPIARAFTPESARELLEVRADEETQRRIDELADKCNEGTLTTDERAEYQRYVSWFNLMTLLQAKARTYLKNNGSTP
jgi:hypothetical protein